MSDPSLSVILTVHDRPDLTLMNVMFALKKCELKDYEILCVDDGSDLDYSELVSLWRDDWKLPIRWERIPTLEHRPDTYHIGGHKNPAFVNNRAIELARGRDLVWLSSDCIVPPFIFDRMAKWDLSETNYCARVVDIDTNAEWCGPSRIFPMCWFLGCSKANVEAIGGYDEEYLKGMAFEDNDFTGRLAAHTGRLVIDQGATVFHQSHPQVAYSDGGEGFERSRDYTIRKWGEVPWERADGSLSYRVSEVADMLILSCKRAEVGNAA